MEIERKFLVRYVTIEMLDVESNGLYQFYLSFNPESRIRIMDEGCFWTKKSSGDLIREEIEVKIPIEDSKVLHEYKLGNAIIKHRYRIPICNGESLAELDLYEGDLEGLKTVEVEFLNEDAANKFIPLHWFGDEVTFDERYKNKNLAQASKEEISELIHGAPQKRYGTTN